MILEIDVSRTYYMNAVKNNLRLVMTRKQDKCRSVFTISSFDNAYANLVCKLKILRALK